MLMVHDPNKKFSGTPDCEYFEFNNSNIVSYIDERMSEDEFEKLNALFKFDICFHKNFPKHLGNFVREYVEKNQTKDFLISDDYDEMIRNALKDYTELTLKQRIKLHMKELDNIRKQLRRESRIWLS